MGVEIQALAQINVPLVSLPVLFHDVLKRPQKVFLESEVGQLPLLQKLHGQLPERVHCENGHIFIGITANLRRDENIFQYNITLFSLLQVIFLTIERSFKNKLFLQ